MFSEPSLESTWQTADVFPLYFTSCVIKSRINGIIIIRYVCCTLGGLLYFVNGIFSKGTLLGINLVIIFNWLWYYHKYRSILRCKGLHISKSLDQKRGVCISMAERELTETDVNEAYGIRINTAKLTVQWSAQPMKNTWIYLRYDLGKFEMSSWRENKLCLSEWGNK